MSSHGNASPAERLTGSSYRHHPVFTIETLRNCEAITPRAAPGTSGLSPRKDFRVTAAKLFTILCAVMLILPGGLSIATGQSEVSDAVEPWMAVVTHEKVTVRCGSSDQYYEVGTLKKGDIVRVVGVNSESGWVKVDSTEGLIAFINAKDVQLSHDGEKAVVVSDCFGLYPREDDPGKSWKRIEFSAGTTLHVLATLKADAESFFKVRLPATVLVSIPVSSVRPATEEEIAAWLQRKNGITKNEAAPSAASKTNIGNTPVVKPAPKANSTPASSNNDNTILKGNVVTPHEKEVAVTGKNDTNAVPTDKQVKKPGDSETGASMDNNDNTVPENTTDVQAPEESVVVVPLSFGDLEVLYERLKKTPILEAEIEPILEGYRKVAADPQETTAHRRLANVRVRLLTIRLQAQQARQRMEAALREADFSIVQSSVEWEAFLDSDLIRSGLKGRLELSNVYDGKRLPTLYRLRDIITGRTITYVRAENMEDLRSFAGQDVYLIGERVMDPVLGVWVLDNAQVVNDD